MVFISGQNERPVMLRTKPDRGRGRLFNTMNLHNNQFSTITGRSHNRIMMVFVRL
jgi:hypothetical protein